MRQCDNLKVLNLYAGIGGNRKMWPENIEVTAVEKNKEILQIYQDHFPNDVVYEGDAIKFLENHYKKYDFIWASPPCPSHSRIKLMAVKAGSYKPTIPDMSLYGIIIFLQDYFEGLWVVENVKSYYTPLIKPIELSRHYFWSNFTIPRKNVEQRNHNKITGTTKLYGFDLTKYKTTTRKDQIIRNCVHPVLAKHIWDSAFNQGQARLEV